MHVAIVRAPFAALLLSGHKRIEARLYRTRRAPVGRIQRGDPILFKLAAGPSLGLSRAEHVLEFSDLGPAGIAALRDRYNSEICAPPQYWQERCAARYGVLIWLGRFSAAPCIDVPRQHGGGWVILSRPPVSDGAPWAGRAVTQV